jgi:predicted CoA-binding protein
MNSKTKENVVILGASDKTDRYAYKAFQLLKEKGHNVFLVHPSLTDVEGQKVYKSLIDINEKINTLTVYVNPAISSSVENEIIKLSPKRVIFNPGAENPILEKILNTKKIDTENACTLVLLNINQF